ncbi:MAG: DUF5677 domain-containing protein [Bdellovibrionales bacterium]|nr:DUF5677 domain-containing protein [Bdellovibrionales bacterium]
MDDLERQSAEALPNLKQFCRELLSLTRTFDLQDHDLTKKDHFKFVLIIYLYRQCSHMNAVLKLENHRDSTLIVRSMLEGLLQLIWMANDPTNRAYRWRLFSYVHDWRVTLERRKMGIKLDAEHLKRIKSALVEHGIQFVTKKKQKTIDLKKELDAWKNPFVKSWFGMTISELANHKDVQGSTLYNSNYSFFSRIHHWDTGSFQSVIERNGNKISYLPASSQELATSFATAFQCLFQTAVLVNTEFGLTYCNGLNDLRHRYAMSVIGIQPPEDLIEGE